VRLALAEKQVAYRSRIVDIELRLQNYERETIATPAEIAEIRRELETVLRGVEDQLGTTAHLASDAYSLADVAWTCVLARLEMAGLASSLWGDGRSPRIEDYYARLRGRPSFKRADVWNVVPTRRARLALMRAFRAGRPPRAVDACSNRTGGTRGARIPRSFPRWLTRPPATSPSPGGYAPHREKERRRWDRP